MSNLHNLEGLVIEMTSQSRYAHIPSIEIGKQWKQRLHTS